MSKDKLDVASRSALKRMFGKQKAAPPDAASARMAERLADVVLAIFEARSLNTPFDRKHIAEAIDVALRSEKVK